MAKYVETLECFPRKTGRTARLKARVAQWKAEHPDGVILDEKKLKRWDRDTASEEAAVSEES